MPIYEDNTKSIGHTPLIRINRLDASSAPPSWQDRRPQSGLLGEVAGSDRPWFGTLKSVVR